MLSQYSITSGLASHRSASQSSDYKNFGCTRFVGKSVLAAFRACVFFGSKELRTPDLGLTAMQLMVWEKRFRV